jgi:hypothetical protein
MTRSDWRAPSGRKRSCWFLPVGSERFWGAVRESLSLVRWYAREHVLLCLVPAFFIAGAISVFVSQGAVMKYLGPRASKLVAYPVAAISGATVQELAYILALTMREAAGADDCWTHDVIGEWKEILAGNVGCDCKK